MFYALQDEPEKGKRLLALAVGVAVAISLQGGGLFAARYYQPAKGLKKAKRSVVAIQVAKPKPPPPKPEPPKPEPKPEPPKPKPEPPEPKPKPKPKPKPRKPKPKPKKPQPPKKPPQAKADKPKPPPKKPAPVKTGITLKSTDARGKGAKINVGNTQMGEVSRDGSAAVTGPAPEGNETVEGPAAEPAPPPPKPTRAKPKSTPKPRYTRLAERNNVEGKIVAILTVGPDGKVKKVRLIKKLGFGLDEAAVESFMQWTYSPATREGKPVQSTVRASMSFVLDD